MAGKTSKRKDFLGFSTVCQKHTQAFACRTLGAFSTTADSQADLDLSRDIAGT